MWYKPYGKTGKQISVIGSGGMRYAEPNDIDKSAAVVMRAYERGVNYFDTAPGYLDDKSEFIVGAALRQMKPGTFYTSTKTFGGNEADLRFDLDKSLKRLGVDHIDFFHIWCIITLDAWRQRCDGGAVKAAFKAKEEGLIKHVVVSSHLPGNELTSVLKEGQFEGVTLGYCAIDFPYRQEAVDAAHAMGLGVVTMNPLGGGLIPQQAQLLDFLRGPNDPSVTAAALRFNISQPAITSALVGFSTVEQVDEACDAVENFSPYPAEYIQSMRERFAPSFKGFCSGCRYCLPCPKGVGIPQMMDAYNHKLMTGKDDAVTMRLAWHWGLKPADAAACAECGVCEKRCTQQLPITQRLKEIAKLA
ncbi:MAG: aldo/keto reductase [Phycisphaerae bacterium]|nr:aldo/keto reductase [Phycisphaerae bacterium]